MQVSLSEMMSFPPEKIIVIDTETTGTDSENDEILSLSVVNGNGEVLFDHLIKPQKRKRWPNATEIHGIKWSDVKVEKELYYYEAELTPLFARNNLIVGYNVWFDIEMIRASGGKIPATYYFDVMKEYSRAHGIYSEWKGENLWVKLSECADYYDYDLTNAHSAKDDALATLHCFRSLTTDPDYLASRRQYEAECAQAEKRYARMEEEAKVKEKSEKNSAIGCGAVFIGIIIFVFTQFFGCLGH